MGRPEKQIEVLLNWTRSKAGRVVSDNVARMYHGILDLIDYTEHIKRENAEMKERLEEK